MLFVPLMTDEVHCLTMSYTSAWEELGPATASYSQVKDLFVLKFLIMIALLRLKSITFSLISMIILV